MGLSSTYRIFPEGEKNIRLKLRTCAHSNSEKPNDDALTSGDASRKTTTILYQHGRRALFGTIVLSILLLLGGTSMYKTNKSIRASRSAFTVLEKTQQFTSDYGLVSTNFQLISLVSGYSDITELYVTMMYSEIERKKMHFSDLEDKYKHHRKHAPELKMANSKFNQLQDLFNDLMEADLRLVSLAQEFGNSTIHTFDSYVIQLHGSSSVTSGLAIYVEFLNTLLEFTDELKKISVKSQTDTQHITLAVQFLLFIVLAGLAFSLHKHFKESSIKLAAQDKLLRQQMHEARNKFCPAMYMMEQFLETAHRHDATIEDFKSQADDMHMALVALREVEAQHQARLDMYKILQGKYVANKETFDILELMRERSAVERTIALARARATHSPIAQFVSTIEDSNTVQHNTCGALYIQTDLYILNHVMANLLSNARKFCSSGQIKVSFNGMNEDLLTFSVRDSGSGLPKTLKNPKSLFGQGVLSGDNRGTGLGLPSCHLFCKTGGGYIKLLGSRQVDEHTSGYTEFEFGLKGKIIRADMTRQCPEETMSPALPDACQDQIEKAPASPLPSLAAACIPRIAPPEPTPRLAPSTCPDNVQIISIDDSALNRTCVIRTFKKIERASNARQWEYREYETIESSMPFLRELKDTSKVIVLLDENLNSRGGLLRGIQGTRWLLHEIHFSGIIISTSGDPDVGKEHLQEGPNVMNWGKPLPKFDVMLADVTKALDSSLRNAPPTS